MASTSSSLASSRGPYDVFLSFGGNDIQKGFTGHLFAALCRSGFNTFTDVEKLESYGKRVGERSLKGIKDSKLVIVLLSKDYASSCWCLDELVQILRCRNADDVWPIFYDVDPSEVEEIKGSYGLAFVEHKKRFEEAIFEEWKDALQQVSYLKGLDLSRHLDGHEARNIDHIVEEITRRLSPKILHVAIHPVGLSSRAREVVSLMDNESQDVRIVGIHGMGGIGKSAIAKEVYNSIHHMYKRSCFLENVRERSSLKGITHLQRKLLTDLLGKKHEKIERPETGLNLIIENIRRSKVLLVLDDVDELNHISNILGNFDWFFPGSRVILTTRIKNFLNPCKLYLQYEVDKLEDNDSLRLLSLHAFGQNYPDEPYVASATKMVHYCCGIPLALEVLGSSLSGQSVAVWSSRLEKLKVVANDDIHSKLKISYDSLDESEQLIFLDMACFFIGYHKDYVLKILEGCGFFPVQSVSTLIRRCLVKVGSNDKLVIHDLLRDMGREIVRQQNAIDPGERSRLWHHEDVIDVLTYKMGTNSIEGLVLNKPGLKYTWSIKIFKKMKMLRLLQLNYARLTGSYEYISSKLRWLCWREFPSKSIPFDLSLENLIALDMRYSSLEQFIESGKCMKKLKFLNLSHSHKLIEIPDFEACQNLEKLILKDCIRLEKIGDTIGLLSNLVFLNFQGCESLKNLPRSIGHLQSLEKLDMSGCSKLETLPESTGYFNSLLIWNLQDCKNLKNFVRKIFGLRSLRTLTLSGCSKLDELPEDLGNLRSLIVLNLDQTGIVSLPESMRNLKKLESLTLRECPLVFSPGKSSQAIRILPYSLKELDLRYCNLIDAVIPDDLGGLCLLKVLKLCGNKFTSLPTSVCTLPNLGELYLNACRELRYIPQVQSSVSTLEADECLSLQSIDLTNFEESSSLKLQDCVNLQELKGYFNLEPLQVEIVEKLYGRSIKNSILDFSIRMIVCPAIATKTSPLQALVERGIYSIFLPGNEVPAWFSHRNEGNYSVSLQVPAIDSGSKIIGVVTYATYAWKQTSSSCYFAPYLSIINKTKMFDWAYHPNVAIFASDAEQDMSWMCYWMFDNHNKNTNDVSDTGWFFKDETERGDEIEFSIDMGFGICVKNCGIHLLCSQPDEELLAISSAASRHHRRFTSVFAQLLTMNSNGEITFKHQKPPQNEEFFKWDKRRTQRIDESCSMCWSKHDFFQQP